MTCPPCPAELVDDPVPAFGGVHVHKPDASTCPVCSQHPDHEACREGRCARCVAAAAKVTARPRRSTLARERLALCACQDIRWVEVTSENAAQFVPFPDMTLALDDHDRMTMTRAYNDALDATEQALTHESWVPCPRCNTVQFDAWKAGTLMRTGKQT